MIQPLLETSQQLAAMPDDEVVGRVCAGETELFEILMRRYNQRLYRVVRAFVTDGGEAEDVTQEAYVTAFRKLGSYRGEARFSTWLTKIAVHEAMRRARKGRRMELVDNDTLERRPSGTASPEREADTRELRDLLREAVEALPDALRSVFVLREVEGLSSGETAAALGLSAGNVRVRVHRAKAHLRRVLDERLGRAARELYLFDGERCDRLVERVFARLPSR